ncbi:MAG: cobalamin-dependent protein [Deltaproteobacteria bacterium]|nr:cobalamin-dependent protein [Deltaproteobacteria bacterium]
MASRRSLSPVLLLGAGAGEAACGILYIASYLRRGGVEAYVRVFDWDVTEDEMRTSLEALLGRVRPKVIGLSLKWFHHVYRAIQLARIIRDIDPEIRIAVGGNTAAHWWRELSALDCFDDIILGDGELPLLALCQGHPAPPNCISRKSGVKPERVPLEYVQSATNSDDVYYSHFSELFLSERDRNAFSGWIAPGKGCKENCLYCAGARKNQREDFGRLNPFVRPEGPVRRDHAEIAPHTWQIRYDFPGSTAEYLEATWAGVDLSKHLCTYFLWGLPTIEMIDALSSHFEKVYVVLDIGCFSELQRQALMSKGVLKPCPTNAELFNFIELSRKNRNVELEVSGIAGLPLASKETLREELKFAETVIAMDCVGGYQRLEAQPGALVTDRPERYDMQTEARSFSEFLSYFEQLEPGDNSVPMIRFKDRALEAEVQRTAEQVSELAWAHRTKRREVPMKATTRLRTAASSRQFTMSDWFGSHGVPARVAKEPMTVVRSTYGAYLNLTTAVSPRKFADPSLRHGEEARILQAALLTFDQPIPVPQGVTRLASSARIDAQTAREAIQFLAEGLFLQPG